MKMISAMGFLALFPALVFAGIGDGNSKGGGAVEVLPGGHTGTLLINAFSEDKDVIGTVLKYYQLAGAVRTENSDFIRYTIPQQELSAMRVYKGESVSEAGHIELWVEVPYEDFIDLGSSIPDHVTAVRLKGELANDLYTAMGKAGLQPVATFSDGYAYEDRFLRCEKSSGMFGTNCSFLFENVSQ